MTSNAHAISKVAVVDDDPDGRESLMDDLRDHNIEPVSINGPYGDDIESLVSELILSQSSFVVCDYRLQRRNFASFNGDKLIAELARRQQPAMLVTVFQSTHRNELRKVRSSLPVVVNRGAFEIERLQYYKYVCEREITNNPVDERRAHRVMIAIESIDESASSNDYFVRVPSWRPETAITLPFECVAPELRSNLRPGDYVLGDVNIGAEEEEELFFINVDEKMGSLLDL